LRSCRALDSVVPAHGGPSLLQLQADVQERSRHPSRIWTGGHFTEPYEQKTQHSSDFGRSIALQRVHSRKYRQASSGIVSGLEKPQ